jgi:hypothetical protein
MTIKKDTPIARRKDPEVDGVYDWDTYGSNTSFIQEVGHHAPTLAQLNADGYLLATETVYDPLTHKLVEPYADSWGDDGVYVTMETVALTADEIANNSIIALAAKVQLIEDGLDGMIDETAKSQRYGTISMSPTAACLAYVGYDNPYREEAEAFGIWKASIWPIVFQIQEDYLKGLRPEPTLEIIISELPPMEWPII